MMKGWIKLGLCIVGVFLFIKFFPMITDLSSTYRMITDQSQKLGIDNAALFYSEDAQTAIAEKKLKDRLNK